MEAVLYLHPAVHQAAVFGIPNRVMGELVGAAATLRPGESLAPKALIAWCQEWLAHYKVPSEVHVVEKMPTTGGRERDYKDRCCLGLAGEWVRVARGKESIRGRPSTGVAVWNAGRMAWCMSCDLLPVLSENLAASVRGMVSQHPTTTAAALLPLPHSPTAPLLAALLCRLREDPQN